MAEQPILFEEMPAAQGKVGRVTLSVAATLNSLTLTTLHRQRVIMKLMVVVVSYYYYYLLLVVIRNQSIKKY